MRVQNEEQKKSLNGRINGEVYSVLLISKCLLFLSNERRENKNSNNSNNHWELNCLLTIQHQQQYYSSRLKHLPQRMSFGIGIVVFPVISHYCYKMTALLYF
jgi:hypothetical protein